MLPLPRAANGSIKSRLLYGLVVLAAVGAPLSALNFAPPCQCATASTAVASTAPVEAYCPACVTNCCTAEKPAAHRGGQSGCDNCSDNCGCRCCEAVAPSNLYVASRVPTTPDDQLQGLVALPAANNSLASVTPSFATGGWSGNLDTRLTRQSLPQLCRWLN